MSSSPILTRRQAQKAKIQTRSMVKSSSTAIGNAVENRRPNAALVEAKRKAKSLKLQNQSNKLETAVKDIFQNAADTKNLIQRPTSLIYDESMLQHLCLWDVQHPECPERLSCILKRCRELNLIERCKLLPSRRANKEEILLLHSSEHYEALESTSGVQDVEHLEELSSKFDSIYLHSTTFDLSLLAVGSTIDLIKNIFNDNVGNGMAIIRPPGHHAMQTEFNGYCFFNNVAIGAQYALEELKLQRIMIIDWDVHHGQGTQRFFYNDPRVLYFSIHRYENGTFWPNLKESDFDAIGDGPGSGYNFNVPLNKTGMGNSDYLAIFQQLVIPVAIEFQPQLILISAGYDAALGCPEGEMEVTPAMYPHLIHPLLKLANSRVAVILEGGYCLESLAEGAALTLRSLLGDPCPELIEDLKPPCPSIQDSILNCIYTHRSYWKSLQLQNLYTIEDLNNLNPQTNLHKINRKFIGGPPLPERFPTRGTAPIIAEELIDRNAKRLQKLKAETKLLAPNIRVCYVYDELMLQHKNMYEPGHPEHPDRIRKIYDMHKEYKLLQRMHRLLIRYATTNEICLVHTRAHVNLIRRIADKAELNNISSNYNSVYFHPKTFDCATLAAGCVLQIVDHVVGGLARSGVCIVRPPGHHAEIDLPHGFCIFNNVAIAAQYALSEHHLKRVLIVDWDVHHGNGTQHIFESNPSVLYISIHRYDNGTFFPKGKDGNFNAVGTGAGIGFNVNIPWNKKGVGDFEYMLAFQQIIMPIAYEFNPQLVLVSAGFDAAVGDPLGGCKVTPEAYGLFTHWLSALANGRIILCLEGGYNVNCIAYAMTMCTKALLDDPIPPIQINDNAKQNANQAAYLSCLETLHQCIGIQQQYWKCLVFDKNLPEVVDKSNNEDFLAVTLENLSLIKDDETVEDASQLNSNAYCDISVEPSCSKPRVKVKTLSEVLMESVQGLDRQAYAVIPLPTCPHLSLLSPEKVPNSIKTDLPCSECQSVLENWLCLSCFQTLCGRYVMQHMLGHHLNTMHSLALSCSDLSVWCYVCEAYVDNKVLHVYKNLAHRYKFGEDMLWSYENDNRMDVNDDGHHSEELLTNRQTLINSPPFQDNFYLHLNLPSNIHDSINNNNHNSNSYCQHDDVQEENCSNQEQLANLHNNNN